MSSSIMNQYRILRGFTLGLIESLDESIADIIPEGYNNNIRWNIGHILVSQYYIMYGPEQAAKRMPAAYGALFGRGSTPRDWQRELPSFATLAEELRTQMERIEQDFTNRLDEVLPQPMTLGDGMEMKTFGELMIFTFYHEGWHAGYIQSLKRSLR